jgi:DNA-binding MarR family transcriptional regulator
LKPDPLSIASMFEEVSLGAPERAVGFVLWRIVHRYQREVDNALQALELTHLQFVVLTLVAWQARSGETVTQAALARFGDIHPMQLSNVLKALEQKKAIVRSPSPAHALAKQVDITAPGVSTLRAALPVVIAIQARLFGDAGLPGGSLLDMLAHIERNAAGSPATIET